MLSPYPSHTVFYGLATVYCSSTFFVNRLANPDDFQSFFLYSEWLCWILLAILAKATEKKRQFAQTDGHNQADKLALAIAALALCWALGEARWVVPLITPACLLLASLDAAHSRLPITRSEKSNGLHDHVESGSGLPVQGLAIAVVIAVSSTILLFPAAPAPWLIGLGFYFVFCLLAIYFILFRARDDASAEDKSLQILIPSASVALRVVVILTLMLFIPTGKNSCHVNSESVIFAALFKVLQWVAVLELVNRGFLLPLSTIATFINSILEISTVPFDSGRSEVVGGVALAALAQTYTFIYKLPHSRRTLLALTMFLFIGLVWRRPIHIDWQHTIFRGQELHPIEVLVQEANHKFEKMVSAQSKTVDAAISEYQRRYNRVPPPGFDEWFKLAQDAQCQVIDEFDTIMQTLEPFWGLSGQEMRERVTMVDQDPLAHIQITNHTTKITKDTLVLSHFNEIVYEWTHRYQHLLPDMMYAINGLAEPRVIVASDRLEHLVHTCAPPAGYRYNGTRKSIEVMDLGKEHSWQIGTRSCPEESPSRSILIPDEPPGLQFVSNATHAKDWCEHPKAAMRHGLFSSPYNLKITDTLVPIFSHGKPSTSQDILYPSPDYLEGYRSGKYDAKVDGAWENKTNKLYWSGSDTGGYATGYEWRNFHRQRFVDLLSNRDNDVSLLRHNSHGQWEKYGEKMASISDLAEVKFSDLTACAGFACSDETKNLPIGGRDDASKMHEYRFLFDIDGMGRTERFYRLLGSKSTVLKQTMHQEWHDDRLVPWVHYVPVSLGMDELPEILRFLTSTEKGQKISKKIADAGRSWQQKALREKDMELAFLRILLEYGRLYSEDRDIEGYCPGGRTRPD